MYFSDRKSSVGSRKTAAMMMDLVSDLGIALKVSSLDMDTGSFDASLNLAQKLAGLLGHTTRSHRIQEFTGVNEHIGMQTGSAKAVITKRTFAEHGEIKKNKEGSKSNELTH